jgi:alanyl-tRNA synthetase
LTFPTYSHVAKTGEIKDFVILEESGIAKGIRRIIAVTGHEAAEVTRLADDLKSRLDRIEQLNGKEKDVQLKAYTIELGQADFSASRKAELKERATALRKAFDKEVKDKEASATKVVVDAFINYFKDNDSADSYIANVNAQGNAKVLQGIVAQGRKLGKALYVFSVDSESEKVVHVNFVPPSIKSKGLDARQWATKVSEILGGKAGGKDDSAQGVGVEVGKVEEAVSVAKSYFSSYR